MSGIFGVAAPGHDLDIAPLMDRMAACMSHRDWFTSDRCVDSEYGVGIGRIGIGIFNKPRQPVWNSDHTVSLVMAGELYNTAASEHTAVATDEQIALALYEKLGDTFVNQLSGAFIIGVWDTTRSCLLIVNDRFALYPLLYAFRAGHLIFAPEMKGILCDPNFHKELDLTALAEYVRFQHLLGDKTFFQDIKLLPNASLLRYNLRTDDLAIQSYWDFSQIPELPPTLTFDDAVEEAGRLLKVSVDRLTTGNYRFGVYLSGGVDSRVILGLIDRDKFPITSITFGQRGCRDVVYAQKIAATAGTQHHYFEFLNGKWVKDFADLHLALTEGFHSWIHSHGISILDQVRPLIDVNLTGFGGGQSAIDWDDPALLRAPDDIAFASRLFHLLSQETTWPSINEAEEKLLFSPRISPQICGLAFDSFRSELAKYNYLPYERRAAYFCLCEPDRRLFQYYTVFHRSHFEQRFPFYDYGYLEFVYALPPEMLFKRRLRRAIICKMMPSLAGIPYDKDDLPIMRSPVSYTAARLVQKGKSAINRRLGAVFPEHATLYADYENWLRNELRDWGEGILLGKRTLERGFFDPEFLRSLWRRHQSGLEVHTIGKIAPLMTWEMLLRKYWD